MWSAITDRRGLARQAGSSCSLQYLFRSMTAFAHLAWREPYLGERLRRRFGC